MKKKISLFGLAIILTIAHLAWAQQSKKIPHVGFLIGSSAAIQESRLDAFRRGLRELGYVEGKSITIEYRYAEGKLDRLPGLAAELVRLKVDVIVTAGPSATSCFLGEACSEDNRV
jgi:putative ABC transport system substrate-binding protein